MPAGAAPASLPISVTTTLLLLGAVALALGTLVGRWPIVAAVAVVWPLYMIGLERGWWGDGVGDAWEYSLVLGAAVSAAASTLGVFLRRGLTRP